MTKEVDINLGGGSLNWPADIATSGAPFLMISSRPYDYALSAADDFIFGSAPPPNTEHVVRILLPTSISSNDVLNYESFSSLASSAIENLADGDWGEAAMDTLNASFGAIGNMTGLGDFASNVKAVVTGKVVKTKEQLIFKAPTLRSHTFTFTMFPRNTNEAKNIATIIYTLKQLAYPASVALVGSGEGGSQFEFPHEFSVSMIPNKANGFPVIREAFLTSITTNFTGQGGSGNLASDGLFQSVELSLTFQDKKLQDDKSIV